MQNQLQRLKTSDHERDITWHLFEKWAKPMFFLFDKDLNIQWTWWWLDFDTNQFQWKIEWSHFFKLLNYFWINTEDEQLILKTMNGLKNKEWISAWIKLKWNDNSTFSLIFYKRADWCLQATLSNISNINTIIENEKNILSEHITNNYATFASLLNRNLATFPKEKVSSLWIELHNVLTNIISKLSKIDRQNHESTDGHSHDWNDFNNSQAIPKVLINRIQLTNSFIEQALPTFVFAPQSLDEDIYILNWKNVKWKYPNWTSFYAALNSQWKWSNAWFNKWTWKDKWFQQVQQVQQTKDFRALIEKKHYDQHFTRLWWKDFFVMSKKTLTKNGHQATLIPWHLANLERSSFSIQNKLAMLHSNIWQVIDTAYSDKNNDKIIQLSRAFKIFITNNVTTNISIVPDS